MKAIFVAVFLVLILITHAGADPIMMTFSDSGGRHNAGSSGNAVSIGGRTVTNAPFTITAVSDTSLRTQTPAQAPLGFSLISISASITVAELGTFDFITPTRVNLIASPNVVGGTLFFTGANSLGLVSPGDIYGGISRLAATWDILSSIRPQFGIGASRYRESTVPEPVVTSGGVLVFNSPQNPGTFNFAQFQANVGSGGDGPVASTADPATLAFGGSGLALLIASAVRRRLPAVPGARTAKRGARAAVLRTEVRTTGPLCGLYSVRIRDVVTAVRDRM